MRFIVALGFVAERSEHADDGVRCLLVHVDRDLNNGLLRPASPDSFPYGTSHCRVQLPREPEPAEHVVRVVHLDFKPSGRRPPIGLFTDIANDEP